MRNMGTTDRIIRVAIAAVIAALYFTGQITGTAALLFGIFALVLLLTSIVGICPSYMPFHFSTRGKA